MNIKHFIKQARKNRRFFIRKYDDLYLISDAKVLFKATAEQAGFILYSFGLDMADNGVFAQTRKEWFKSDSTPPEMLQLLKANQEIKTTAYHDTGFEKPWPHHLRYFINKDTQDVVAMEIDNWKLFQKPYKVQVSTGIASIYAGDEYMGVVALYVTNDSDESMIIKQLLVS